MLKKVVLIVCGLTSVSFGQATIKDTEPGAVDAPSIKAQAAGDTPSDADKARAITILKELARILGVEDQIMSDRDAYLKTAGWVNNPNQPGGLWLWEKELTYTDAAGAQQKRYFRVERDTAITIQLSIDDANAPPSTSSTAPDRDNLLKTAGWTNNKGRWERDLTYRSADGDTITRRFRVTRDVALLFEQEMGVDTLNSLLIYDAGAIEAIGGKKLARF